MTQRKLAPILAIAISLELIIAPVAVHAQGNQSGGGASEVLNTVLGVATTIYQGMRPLPPPSPNFSKDMAALNQQQTNINDKYFNRNQLLSQIPGLGRYLQANNINPNLLNCATLPTNLYEAHNEVCRIGVTADKGDPNLQAHEAFTYMNAYTSIAKKYSNFTTPSNAGGELFGVGCMANALQVLNGFFESRINELDKLVTNMEALQNNFREASRSDLDAIEESTALLNGGSSEITNKVKSKRPDLFDFGKRFDNPACQSMFSKEDFNKQGKGGLNAINLRLQKDVSTKSGGAGFSGESYAKGHQDVIKDINSLADKVGKQMELNFDSISGNPRGYSELLRGLGGQVSSPNQINKSFSPDFFADMQTKFTEQNDKLNNTSTDIAQELAANGKNADRLINLARGNNTKALESELTNLKQSIDNDCLKENAQLSTVIDKIYDPSASSFANKNASNFMKDKLKQIMENDKTSLDKKLRELKALEAQQGSRYFVRMENSYEVQEVNAQGKLTTRVVEASTSRTPSVFFSDAIKNCNAQFKVNHLGNNMSGATAIQKLRQQHKDYQTLATNHSREVKEEIKKKLIQCESPAQANNSISGSCTPASFDTTKAGFCANAAFSCSKNMQACSKQAEKFVTDIKQGRTARVNNYKKMIEKNKRDIVKIFDTALSQYMREGEALRGAFGVGFSSPAGIQREVPDNQKHLAIFQQATAGSEDGTLLLEDPDKYVAMLKNNVGLLKQSVQEQQEQIVGGAVGSNSGIFAQHMKDTEQKYKKIEAEAKKFAQNCQSQHDKFVLERDAQTKQQGIEQARIQTELGQKSQEFCRNYGTAQEHPGPACGGSVQDLTSAVAALPGGAAAGEEFKLVCDQFNNEGGSTIVETALSLCPISEAKPQGKADPQEVAEAEKEFIRAEQFQTKTTRAFEAAEKKEEDAKREEKMLGDQLTAAKAARPNVPADITELKAKLDTATGVRKAATTATAEAKVEKNEAQDILKAAVARKEKAKEIVQVAEPTTPKPKDETLSDEDQEYLANCERLNVCQEGSRTSGTGENRETFFKCTSAQENNLAKRIFKLKGRKANPDLMPAFCAAGNNGSGPPKNFFTSILSGFQGANAPGAVGQ